MHVKAVRRAIGLKSLVHSSAILSSTSSASAYSAGEFRELVQLHQSRVFSIALRILGDRGTAEEVAQDVFLALYRDLDRFQSEEHLLAWLRRVAVHRATDACRRRTSRVDSAAEEFQEERMPATGTTHAGGSVSDGIEELIATLPPKQRAIVLLRYQEDMLPMDIAQTLGMPLATVKSNLQRALKQLRTQAGTERVRRTQKEIAHG